MEAIRLALARVYRFAEAIPAIREDVLAIATALDGHAGGMTPDEVCTLTGLVEGLVARFEDVLGEDWS